MKTLLPWRPASRLRCFEWNYLERHAEHRRDFLSESAVLIHFVIGSPKPAPDDLLAKQLRHEGAQADNVCHRVAVPSLRQHADANDAAHVPPGWMERSLQLFRQLFESLRIDRPALFIAGPACLSDCIQRKPHPPCFVALRLSGIRFVDNL